jgi:hypothetical protein
MGMLGCDGCGAQVRRDDTVCPICGAAVVVPLAAAGYGPAEVQIRRYGKIPRMRAEGDPRLAEPPRAGAGSPAPRLGAFLLAIGVFAAGVTAFVSYWLR